METNDRNKKSLVSVTKQIIRAAATLGIEEAGTRVMGSVWGPFKTMMKPVIKELEKRFPKFFLLDVAPGNTPSSEAKAVAENAINELSNDATLQQIVLDNFNKLSEGQYEIKNQIENIEIRLDALDISIDGLSNSNDAHFENIMSQLTGIQQKLDNMGKSVGFNNSKVIFPLTLELPKDSIEANVSLYIAGCNPINFSVNKKRPHITVNVSVPKADNYSYHLEHQETATLYLKVGNNFEKRLVPIQSVNDGQIDITPNSVYKLERMVVLGGGAGNKATMHLAKVLPAEEKEITQEEADAFLDSLM